MATESENVEKHIQEDDSSEFQETESKNVEKNIQEDESGENATVEEQNQPYPNIQNFINNVVINVSYITKRGENLVKQIDYNKYLDKLSQRPLLATVLVLLSAITVLAITTFVLLISTTAAITLTGIALIEGTVITISTIIFCGCLISIWLLVAVFVIVGACFYYGTLHIHKEMQTKELATVAGFEQMRSILKNQLPEKEE